MRWLRSCFPTVLLLSTCAACGGGSTAPGPDGPGAPPGTPGWALTESLAGPLRNSIAVSLADGRVLLVGGTQASTGLRLYDPATHQWTDGPFLQHARGQGSSATRLPDGRVAIVGGTIGDARTSVEVYDPATNGVTLAPGTSSAPRAYHAAALLPDGRLLVAGGTDGSLPAAGTDTADLWDPATGLFTPTDPMAHGRAGPGAARLGTGEILVIGSDDGGIYSKTCERFDPGTETWGAADDLNLARAYLAHTVAVAGDGRVLATGGGTSGAELYDPVLDVWTLRTDLTEAARTDAVTVKLDDGGVLLAGGLVGAGPVTTDAAEVFDPGTDAFSAVASMHLGRTAFSAALLGTGQVLAVEGLSDAPVGDTETCEVYTAP